MRISYWMIGLLIVLLMQHSVMALLDRREVTGIRTEDLESLHTNGGSFTGTGYWGSVYLLTTSGLAIDDQILQAEGVNYRIRDVMIDSKFQPRFKPGMIPDDPEFQGNASKVLKKPVGTGLSLWQLNPSRGGTMSSESSQRRLESVNSSVPLSDFLSPPSPKPED